jgi:hypothetical protein
MKKTLFTIAIISIIMSSCKNEKNESQAIEQKTEEIVVDDLTAETQDNLQVLNNNWIKEIQLDNGNKWTANEETNIGVLKMNELLTNQATITLDDYHNLAAELTNSKNYVIKECTMKGPPHDNLHVWLLPLMEKIDALEETNSTEEAEKIKFSIEENINAYFNYFQ